MRRRAPLRPARDDRGGVSAQAAAMAPLLAIVAVVVLFTGRVVEANNAVQAAAHEAARAATLTGPADAAAAARSAAAANLNTGGLTCRTLDVAADLTQFRAGGTVTATVTCTADFADMDLIGVPGSKSFSATAVEVIDAYRGG